MLHLAEVAVRAACADAAAMFPGQPEAAPSARRFVRGYLRGPRVDDLELIACELITNSVRHASVGNGSEFIVRVRTGKCWVRVEVSDARPSQQSDEYSREMVVIAAVADRFGREATASGQTRWAEIYWASASGYGYMQLLAGQRPPDLAELLRETGSRPPTPHVPSTLADSQS